MSLVPALLHWYDRSARDLPWRAPGVSPWAVLVSEVMLQQTPVSRVLPVYEEWVDRWPTPDALAAASPGDAVRGWGRLGYPGRARRLHACAVAIRDRFDGRVPSDVDELLTLPGIGPYTARAVAAFAFGARVPVVDTNVRRVVARAVEGVGAAGSPSPARDHAVVEALLPADPATAARFGVAVMELGALICVARTPRCVRCPIRDDCAWLAAGAPAPAEPPRPRPAYAGSDRQVRGLLLGVLREAADPVARSRLDLVWGEVEQRARALDSLVRDGLVQPLPDGRYALGG